MVLGGDDSTIQQNIIITVTVITCTKSQYNLHGFLTTNAAHAKKLATVHALGPSPTTTSYHVAIFYVRN